MVIKHTMIPVEGIVYCRNINGLLEFRSIDCCCKHCPYFFMYGKNNTIVCEYDGPVYKHDVTISEHENQYDMINISEDIGKAVEGFPIANERQALSYDIWESLRDFAYLYSHDEENIIDCMGMDFDITICKGESATREFIEAYNCWFSKFIKLIKTYDNPESLTESNISFNEVNYYDYGKAMGLPVYNIEVVVRDIRDIDCDCIVEVSRYDEQDFRFLRNDFGRAEYTIFIPDIERTFDEGIDYSELQRVYRTILNMAYMNEIRSIAIPVIAFTEDKRPDMTGIYIAVEITANWLDENNDYELKVYFCCYEETTANEYDRLLFNRFRDDMDYYDNFWD